MLNIILGRSITENRLRSPLTFITIFKSWVYLIVNLLMLSMFAAMGILYSRKITRIFMRSQTFSHTLAFLDIGLTTTKCTSWSYLVIHEVTSSL